MPSTSVFKPAIVEWIDAHSFDDDVELDDIEHAPTREIMVGWLVRDDDIGVTLAMCYADDDATKLRRTWFVPRCMVVAVCKLG